MWSPTHVQILVKKAKGLKIKGKDGTNDAFVTIALGKEKYQTSVKEKATESVEWCEQCELTIPTHGNTAEIVLTALHRNFLGVDEFLGLVTIPLKDFDVYDRPRTKWYQLKCKPGQAKNDYRGDLEVRTSFTVKAVNKDVVGSTADLGQTSKHKGSLQSLNKAASNFGGSLLSIGQKEKKHLKKIAKTVTHKVEKVGEKAKKNLSKANLRDNTWNVTEKDKLDNSVNRFTDPFSKLKGSSGRSPRTLNSRGFDRNQDPGVNSDDEDGLEAGGRLDDDDMFRFDALSQGSSASSINVSKVDQLGIVSKTSTPLSGSFENLAGGELLRKSTPGGARRSFAPHQESPLLQSTPATKPPAKPPITEDMDEWELKLLGKKGVPYINVSTTDETGNASDNRSQNLRGSTTLVSGSSVNSANVSQTSSRTNTLERSGERERPKLKIVQEASSQPKKKIIPVHSDFESSPSPEECPSSPSFDDAPPRLGSSFTYKTSNVGSKKGQNEDGNQPEKKKRLFGKMMGKTSGSFRSEKDNNDCSTENLARHTRTYSDGSVGSAASSGIPPPSGPRVVLGRETSPTTGNSNSSVHDSYFSSNNNGESHGQIPKEVWDRFEGKSREDLIEMIVSLQGMIEIQARKQNDLEDYIDVLLMKVLSAAPQLLQKAGVMSSKPGLD